MGRWLAQGEYEASPGERPSTTERALFARIARLEAASHNESPSPGRRALSGVPASDALWGHFDRCRARCISAGKLDVFPVVFVQEALALRLPPDADWKPYGQSIGAAFKLLCSDHVYVKSVRREISTVNDENGKLSDLLLKSNRSVNRLKSALQKAKLQLKRKTAMTKPTPKKPKPKTLAQVNAGKKRKIAHG